MSAEVLMGALIVLDAGILAWQPHHELIQFQSKLIDMSQCSFHFLLVSTSFQCFSSCFLKISALSIIVPSFFPGVSTFSFNNSSPFQPFFKVHGISVLEQIEAAKCRWDTSPRRQYLNDVEWIEWIDFEWFWTSETSKNWERARFNYDLTIRTTPQKETKRAIFVESTESRI